MRLGGPAATAYAPDRQLRLLVLMSWHSNSVLIFLRASSWRRCSYAACAPCPQLLQMNFLSGAANGEEQSNHKVVHARHGSHV